METLNEIFTAIAAVVTVYILGSTVVALAEFITWYFHKEKTTNAPPYGYKVT